MAAPEATRKPGSAQPRVMTVDTQDVRFPLGLKVSAIVVVIVIILCGVTLVVVGQQLETALLGEFRSKGEGIAKGLGQGSVALLMRDERDKVQAFVEELSKTGGVGYVAINDPLGKIISHSMGAGDFPKRLSDAISGGEEITAEAKITDTQFVDEALGSVLDISYPIMNGALGRAHVGMILNGVNEQVRALWVRVGGVFFVFMLLGSLAAIIFSRGLVRPLYGMVHVVGEVSTGNLAVRAESTTRDELATLASSVNRMIASLQQIVSSVRLASVQVSDASEEILATSRDQERGVGDQVGSIEEIAQTMNALADTARAIANNADSLTKLSDSVSNNIHVGQEAMNRSRQSMSHIVGQNQIIVDRINKLYEQSESIISVIDIIDSISDRLDLLALNAALEGSRAGEVGKGFSLVAHEMRRLAENVMGSTKEIKSTVREIHGLTQAALEASHQGSDTTKEGAAEMEKTVGVMAQIFDLIGKTTESARQITVITQQQLSSSQQIVTAMRDVAHISTEGMTAAQQVTRAAQDLADLSASLRNQVSRFTVEDAPAATTEAPATPKPATRS